jgi:hypothetical protein
MPDHICWKKEMTGLLKAVLESLEGGAMWHKHSVLLAIIHVEDQRNDVLWLSVPRVHKQDGEERTFLSDV